MEISEHSRQPPDLLPCHCRKCHRRLNFNLCL
jgi:hypothetical protein